MTEYFHTGLVASRSLPPTAVESAIASARSWAKARRIKLLQVQVRLLMEYIAVLHFEGLDLSRKEKFTAWLVGGNLPHLELGDEEIANPIEALAIYVHVSYAWTAKKGIDPGDGSIADYRVPPNWELLNYYTFLEDGWPLGAICSDIGFSIVPANKEHITSPGVREICERHGWLHYDPFA